ncbi:hypothetical protein C8Q75DRAFT_225705 [Abortiporus biennis]|nr:hypothetical protein C8Q75DRAFT_225705 [Abortiporus biennis]
MSSHKPVKGLSKQSAGGSTTGTSRSKAPTPTSVSTIRTGKTTRKVEPSPLSVSQTAPKSSLTRTESKSTPGTRTSKANNHHNLSWKSKQTGVVKETARITTTSSAQGEPGSHDVLQIAAQLYSWYYMTSSLEKCRLSTQQNVSKLLQKRTAQLEAEEAEIADSRTRYEAEQILDFYDEISEERIASRLPVLVDGFIKHEETYNKTMKDALNVVHLKPSEFDQCNVLLQNLRMPMLSHSLPCHN